MQHLVSSTIDRRSRLAVSRVVEPAEDETVRLCVLKRYEVFDTLPEAAFDRVTALAADLYQAPISIIGFVGQKSVSFKSHHGLAEAQVDRGPGASACALDPWLRRKFKHGFYLGVPLSTHEGYELGRLSVVDRRPRRINQLQMRRLGSLAAIVMDQLEQRLSARKAAQRAEMRASEVDHRAMNSLQFIASLLRLQSSAVDSRATSLELMAASGRILAVARVHRAFSVDENLDRVPIVAYLQPLCGELSRSLATDIAFEGVEASVPNTQILAIGLIVNELVTNARKHGAGQITVGFRFGLNGCRELYVLDQGEGLPEDFVARRPSTEGLGMKVVNALVTQLDGRFFAGPNPAGRGSCFVVTFPDS